MRVLLTGAAGFIGAAVATRLAAEEVEVVAVDALIPQAHREYPEVEPGGLHRVDVRDAAALPPLLRGVDVVCHQAAMVGAGVAASDLPLFAGHNDLGTATLLAAMHEAGVGRLVLASSMVVYGEGGYRCEEHGAVVPPGRPVARLDRGSFEHACPACGRPLSWTAVPETARLDPRSGYAASKVAQEHYTAAWTRQAGTSAVALRYHNVYGPGMPRDTPYAGVAAIFRSALERGDRPRVFEDGAQVRDFVHVDDVARANVLALHRVLADRVAPYQAYNVCSGRPVTIADVARMVAGERGVEPVVTGEHRPGDVRHVVASPELARRELGYTASVPPERGLAEFAYAPLR